MGLLDIFKSKNQQEKNNEVKTKIIAVDNIYLIDIPEDWTQYESDRFRTVNKDKSITFSASNYGKPLDKNNPFTPDHLKAEVFSLFERFVSEGGYESIGDRETANNYIYEAFKVDRETQYYYHTYRIGVNQLIRIAFILKEQGSYNLSTKKMLLQMGESIKIKVA